MELKTTDINETRKNLIVSVSGDEIAQEEKRLLKEFGKSVRIPGFRPGKAPETMIRQRYGKELQAELNKAITQKVYQTSVSSTDVDIFNIVEFPDTGDFKGGEGAEIELVVDVNPEFELPDYKGIEIKSESTEVSDKEVDDMIETLRRQRADFTLVEREAQESDYLKLSYEGKIGKDPLEEKLSDNPALKSWGKVEESWEEAGTEEAKKYGVPAVIDALVGMKAGDKKTAEQVIPDDFAVENLRGKKVLYEIEVHEVRERKLPEIDEDFLKSVQAETVEDFKSQILDHLESQKKQQAEESKRQQLLDNLAETIDIPLPESGVESETQTTMQRIMTQNMSQGIAKEELEKNRETLFATSRQTAEREVKLQIILGKIADKEEVKVENEDLSRAVYGMAMQSRQDPQEFAKELRKDRSRLMQLQRQVLFSKTLDILVNSAKVSK